MKFLEKVTKVESFMAAFIKWIGYISAFILVVGWTSSFFKWGNSGFFTFIREHLFIIWAVAVSTLVITLLIWVTIIHNRYARGFADKFRGDLRANWDFTGDWRIPEKKTLLVTGSDSGGITKIGAQWENYQLTFKTKIINKCLGVIVRAQDLNNYYMFQINKDKIVPHRRAAVPVIASASDSNPSQAISFQVGWEISNSISLDPVLNDWFNVKIIVKGQSFWIYINDNLTMQEESFLKIPIGKIGFRNWKDEKALIKDVRVILQ